MQVIGLKPGAITNVNLKPKQHEPTVQTVGSLILHCGASAPE